MFDLTLIWDYKLMDYMPTFNIYKYGFYFSWLFIAVEIDLWS